MVTTHQDEGSEPDADQCETAESSCGDRERLRRGGAGVRGRRVSSQTPVVVSWTLVVLRVPSRATTAAVSCTLVVLRVPSRATTAAAS